MKKRWWLLLVVVLVVDVVTVAVPLFSPPWRALTITVLTAVLLVAAALRLLEVKQQKAYERAALEGLERRRREWAREGPPPGLV